MLIRCRAKHVCKSYPERCDECEYKDKPDSFIIRPRIPQDYFVPVREARW